jgi:hypothetical protein
MKDLQTVHQGLEKATKSGVFTMKEVGALSNAMIGLYKIFESPVEVVDPPEKDKKK